MIVVKVELHSAITGKITTLGQAVIANDGKHGANSLGNYDMSVANKRTAQAGDLQKTIEKAARRGRITNFPRKSYSIWRMVTRLLLDAFPEEQPR